MLNVTTCADAHASSTSNGPGVHNGTAGSGEIPPSPWLQRNVLLKFALSDLTLFKAMLPLQVRMLRLTDKVQAALELGPPPGPLPAGCEGFAILGLPLAHQPPALRKQDGYLYYVQKQYLHYSIDLSTSHETYEAKFSSKTRSTIHRKIRKFAKQCGGEIHWRTYRTQEELDVFFALATPLSKHTYQEQLLSAGLPDEARFRSEGRALAERDQVRAYLLFDGERPVSYLYCPVENGVLSYSYVGYDPAYLHQSVGTILQWLAVEQLFKEQKFRYFDFTEGQSDHKRLFSTDERMCANVYMVRQTLRNGLLLRLHLATDRISSALGVVLERMGVKARIKRILRFSRLQS